MSMLACCSHVKCHPASWMSQRKSSSAASQSFKKIADFAFEQSLNESPEGCGTKCRRGERPADQHKRSEYDDERGQHELSCARRSSGPLSGTRFGLVVGLTNDGIAPVPGVLRLSVLSEDNTIQVSGCIDPGSRLRFPMTAIHYDPFCS